MNWEAANVPRRNKTPTHVKAKELSADRRSTETVEAALSRLSKAYNTSMSCVGSLHKTNKMVLKEKSPGKDVTRTLKRVANAARRTLEFAILIDPLILPHAPTVNQTIQELANGTIDRWQPVGEKRPLPPVLSSAAHKATIRELAYLSLVNYSDLLISCCVRESSKLNNKQSILDRGVVTKIESLDNDGQCCWSDEAHEDIQRLALTALCDASNLDASDPILWLKIASAARGLERIVNERNNSILVTTKYRRLQRYALERGSSVLPSSVPPNRAIGRALKELSESTPEFLSYESVPIKNEEPTEILLELPRYSWSIFGRLILRACREGSEFQTLPKDQRVGRLRPLTQFGSPVLRLCLNPLLVLPPNLLGRICSFLDVVSAAKFESTCRGIAFSMINAKSFTENKAVNPEKETAVQNEKEKGESKSDESIKDDGKKEAKSENREKGKQGTQSHRTSKRLRSQQITSGKIAERSSHRQSFNYCFLAATMTCTRSEFSKQVNETKAIISNDQDHAKSSKSEKKPRTDWNKMHQQETKERLSPASISTFVERWNAYNNGPIDVLFKFLSHIALNVQDVFACDPRGPMELTSCILSGFEHYIRRHGSRQDFAPRFYKPVEISGSFERSLELLALDLLYTELTLRKCDRYTPTHVEFDDDSNMVALLTTGLLEAFNNLDKSAKVLNSNDKAIETFAAFSIRCNWLAAGFFLWRSRIARATSESREAEEEAIYFIEETSKLFDSPFLRTSRIMTPHLVSIGRTDPYWKEISPSLMKKLRDEIQASSVVSIAKQKYEELLAAVDKASTDSDSRVLPEDAVKSLADIGETLYERYESNHGDTGAKHIELVEDFLSIHAEDLGDLADVGLLENGKSPIFVGSVDFKDLRQVPNPSILSMLIVCLKISKGRQLDVTQLLMRALMSAVDQHGRILDRIQDVHSDFGVEDQDDSDDDSVFSNKEGSNKGADELRARHCGLFVIFLLKCIRHSFSEHMSESERLQLTSSNDLLMMIKSTTELAGKWYQLTGRRWEAANDNTDEALFQALRQLVAELCTETRERFQQSIHRVFFVGMLNNVTSHRHLLLSLVKMQGSRGGRAARQKLCVKRAKFLGMICSELGYILSLNLGRLKGLEMIEGALFGDTSKTQNMLSRDELLLFYDAILGLWKYASMVDSESAGISESKVICSAFDRPIIKELKIPMAGLIVGLCGSGTRTRPPESKKADRNDPLCLTEFFDSDASANEWLADEDDGKRELLRSICHAIYSINLVLSVVDDKGALSTFSYIEKRDKFGPLLPLIAVRVLNHFADSLLLKYGDTENSNEKLWVKEYPETTQTIGELLDSLLRKSYGWLHGFSLVGEQGHQSSGKEAISSTITTDLDEKSFPVESTAAAAQLYRCIMRAYASGRRSPPKAALEAVSSALPPLQESAKSKLLKDFIFASNEWELGLQDITKLIKKDSSWDSSFSKIQSQLISLGDESSDGSKTFENDIMRLRRGISGQLADGQLPRSASDAGKNKADSGQENERLFSTRQEEEISKKFFAIFDDLCLGNIKNAKGWYRAAQCLVVKAELIADRLGLSTGFSRNNDFSIPYPRPPRRTSVDLSVLQAEQQHEETRSKEAWIPHLGNNLSLYIKHSWSSFDSLILFSSELVKELEDEMDMDVENSDIAIAVWKEIQSMYNSGNFLKWQEAWGGIFVYALRKLSLRFMCMALYLIQSNAGIDADDRLLMSEICESIGIGLYSELMGSQVYGYPMRIMSTKRKRDLATSAKLSFQSAVDIVEYHGSEDTDGKDKSIEARVSWDLVFMIGKCDEKIAKTYIRETFSGTIRRYEHHMNLAMLSYSKALKQAETIEKDVGFDGQNGGSAHGYTEVLYRLHASRLKCLLVVISQSEDTFHLAEAEALRLTETNWFTNQTTEDSSNSKDSRDRIWDVLTDLVGGLVQCRLNHTFFHRSVFRHAQALMWAPILCDPSSSEGSLGTVPPHRSCHLRGLNHATHAANSAEVIMSTLFDRKRSQICGIWVTATSAPSPFEILNNSTRKFDSLRGKYISAYIESLQLCDRRNEMEQFMKVLSSSKRDLPSYFQASALDGGKVPDRKHDKENLLNTENSLMSLGLLVNAKRQANSAFSAILLKSISKTEEENISGRMTPESLLKHAYACYLRLNCDPQDLRKTKAMKYRNGSINEVELLCQAYLHSGLAEGSSFNLGGDWSGMARKSAIFNQALEKCQSLFPSLSGNFLFRKEKESGGSKTGGRGKRKAPVEESSSEAPDEGPEEGPEEGRNTTEETSKISFEVTVPENLVAGDTFLTNVKYGDNISKRLKLTVPEGNPSTLRFSLTISAEERKEKKPNEED